MYVADWIDGWDTKDFGRIWKLDDPSGKGNSDRINTLELLQADFNSKSPAELGEILSNPDMRVRQKAQFELELTPNNKNFLGQGEVTIDVGNQIIY